MNKKAKIFDMVIENISKEISIILKNIPSIYKDTAEEIRLRNEKPLSLLCGQKEYFISSNGEVLEEYLKGFVVRDIHIQNTFQIITNYSVYAYSEEIKNGYITIRGGHRVGIGGKVIYGQTGIEKIKDISSLNIRIGREVLGVSDNLMKYIITPSKSIYNTLIISPPQCGKTTLLRDMVRNLSNGIKTLHKPGFKVSVIDERSELAGVYNGTPQNDIGIRTDVLDGCLKSDGIIMAIRALSPDVVAVDEIGNIKDIEAINEALRTGVKIIATIHGSSMEEIKNKISMKNIIDEKIFDRFIILSRENGAGTVKQILDGRTFKEL